MNIVQIDGVKIPPPSSLSVGMQDLDSEDSTRNERGYLQRDMIRSGLYKIDLGFNVKTGSEISQIESLIADKSSMSVTFPDSGGMSTRTMYVGDRTKEMVLYKHGSPSSTRWTLTFNLVEF